MPGGGTGAGHFPSRRSFRPVIDSARPCRDQRAVYDLPQGETGFQTRHYLVGHQVLHFEGNARQRNHDFAVLFEPHAGGRAVGVEKHGAARRDERLIAVQAVVFDSACFEHAPHVVGDGLIAYEPGAEELGEGLFRDVVLGGAEAAGQDDYVALAHGPFYGLGDLLALVADRRALPDDDRPHCSGGGRSTPNWYPRSVRSGFRRRS